jgi:endonuclease/exonuclease/phosphatase family metal-dependent hydrolase
MRMSMVAATVLSHCVLTGTTPAQVELTGRLWRERTPGSGDMVPFVAIYSFASLPGSDSQASGFRTWEMHPSGWYRHAGGAGNYTISFAGPDQFARPVILTNIFAQPGDKLDRNASPPFDYCVLHEGAWDEKAASHYYQTFTARGTSITQVGFKLAHDGVDGGGPGGQNVLLSIHRRGAGTPDTWEQVGPAATVLNVDCGGPKGYTFSAGWNSGDVPTTPGETYAVHLRPESPTGTFQTFWKEDKETTTDCYRLGEAGITGFTQRNLWMTIASDSDGLVIPYNKCVHKLFGEFAGSGRVWTQTYVARGRGLASVVLYAAVSGTQPPLMHQRVMVRVREGGPLGPPVGIEKIAIGNGTYTGDASWGCFGAVFAPGEVNLTPGKTYAIEFESIENYETLHGWVDIKGRVSDEVTKFNPYRKFAPDTYEPGVAYLERNKEVDFDLDMQVIEYEFAPDGWADAVQGPNLLVNGDMEAGQLASEPLAAGEPEGWQPFAVDPGTTHVYMADGETKDNRILRVVGGSETGKTADGGYVQRVAGLDRLETYQLAGRVRSSWAVDDKHQCRVGFDPTGQTDDPQAATIVWTTLPGVRGWFMPYKSDPIRPAQDAISVWLRAKTTLNVDAPFRADFDDFALRQVRTAVPTAVDLDVMTFNIRYGTANDGDNHWDKRKDLVVGVLRDHAPDVVGLQEALRFQIDYIRKALPQYGEVGVGRDDGAQTGEYSAILYRTNRLEAQATGTFWLSDTPEVPGSRSWGNDIPRVCTWARLVDKRSAIQTSDTAGVSGTGKRSDAEEQAGKAFYLYNTHLDHRSQPSRERSVDLIARHITTREHPDAVVLTGDFNADEANEAIRYLKGRWPQVPAKRGTCAAVQPLVDTFRVLHPDAAEVGTFNGFKGNRSGGKIDYVFAPPTATVLEAEILYDNSASQYPSDHYPVRAKILLPTEP